MFELPKKFDREYSGIFRTIGRDVFSAGILKKENTTIDWQGGSFPLFSVSLVTIESKKADTKCVEAFNQNMPQLLILQGV